MTGPAAYERQPSTHGDGGGGVPRRAWSTRRRVLVAGLAGAGLVAAALALTPGLGAGPTGTAAPSAVTAAPAAPSASVPSTPAPSTTVTDPATPSASPSAATAPLPPLEQRWLDDGPITSDSPQAGDVLQDGAFAADVLAVDVEARTITVDVVLFYGGDDAWAIAREREPDMADQVVNNGYYIVNDVARERVLGVTADVRVGVWCYDEGGLQTVELTFAQWATPVVPGETTSCGVRGWPLPSLYWLDVRSGLVAQVTEQYVP